MAQDQPEQLEQQEPDPWEQELARLERWVAEGRPDLLRQSLVMNEGELGQEERLDAFLRGMDVACGKGPQYLIELAFTRMLRTCVLLQLRLECAIEPVVRTCRPGAGDEVRQLQAEALPAIERLQRHIAQISKVYATIRHLLGLAEPSDEQAFRERILKVVREVTEPLHDSGTKRLEAKVG